MLYLYALKAIPPNFCRANKILRVMGVDVKDLVEKFKSLSDEEKMKFFEELEKEMPAVADGGDPADPPEEYSPGAEIMPSVEDIVSDYLTGVRAKAGKWKARVMKPKVSPVKAAVSKKEKYYNRMREVIDQDRWAKALEKAGEAAIAEGLRATTPDDYRRGVERKVHKFERKWRAMYELRVYAKRKLMEMPVDTPEQREAKLVAAKRMNEVIGLFLKGVITKEEAMRRIDTLAAGRF